MSSSTPKEPSLVYVSSTRSNITCPTVASLPASMAVNVEFEYPPMTSVLENMEKPENLRFVPVVSIYIRGLSRPM